MTGNKSILYIALAISVVTYLFWDFMPKGSWYVGNGFFIFLLCLYLFLKDKKSFICFALLTLSLNNLLDELLFDPKNLGINEIILGLCLVIKYRLDVRTKKLR